MKLRSVVSVVVLGAAALVLAPGTANAAPPNSGCPTGFVLVTSTFRQLPPSGDETLCVRFAPEGSQGQAIKDNVNPSRP